MFEYFTFPGNGEVIRSMLDAAATISGSGMMASAAQALSLFGFMVTLGIAVYKVDLKDNFVTLMVIMAVWMGVMTPKTSVVVTEAAGHGHSGYMAKVDNVPLGLAIAGNLVSSLGYHMTNKMEQVYSTPDDLSYTKSGVLFGARLLENLRTARITDATLTADWALFMHQCSFFDMHLYHFYNINELRDSEDIIGTLGKTNVALFTNVKDESKRDKGQIHYGTTSTVRTCKQAYDLLKDRSEYLVRENVAHRVAARTFGLMGINPGVSKVAALQKLGNNSFQYLLNNSRFETVKNIEQVAMAEIIRQSGVINGQRGRNPTMVQQTFAQVQARNQYIAAQKSGALMAGWQLPVVRSAIEAVLIGLFPLVVLLALMAGISAFKLLMFYMGGLLWIQLWAPVASVINYVMTLNTKRLFLAEATQGMLTPGSTDTLLMAAADAQAAAGAAMWLIPVIAGALAFGGRTLLSGMMGMATGAKATAEAAGQQVGAGNISAGNMSYNNVSTNKYNPSPLYTDPQMLTAQTSAGTGWRQLVSTTSRFASQQDSYPITPTATISESESYAVRAEQSQTAGRQQLSTAQSSYTAANNETLAWAVGKSRDESFRNDLNKTYGANTVSAFDRVYDMAAEIAQKNGMGTSSEAASIVMGDLSARINQNGILGFGGGFGLKAIKQAVNKDQYKSDIENASKALRKEGVSFRQDLAESIREGSAWQNALQQNESMAVQANASLSKARSATLSAQESFAQAQSYAETAARTVNSGSSVTINASRHLNRTGMTAQEIYERPEQAAQAAISAAKAGDAGLRQAAAGTGYDVARTVSVNDRPANRVAETHRDNLAGVNAADSAHRQAVYGQAAAAGFDSGGINGSIQGGKDGLSADHYAATTENTVENNQAKNRYEQSVGNLLKQTEQMQRGTDSLFMRLNSKQMNIDTRAAQETVRAGKGLPGSGYDKSSAELADNPHLYDRMTGRGDVTRMPGNDASSGSVIFRPKP